MTRKWIDPAHLWETLSPTTQQRLGTLALALGLVRIESLAVEIADLVRVETAEAEILSALESALTWNVPGIDGMRNHLVDLNQIGIRMCRTCGCTEAFNHPRKPGWANQTLCVACSESGSTA